MLNQPKEKMKKLLFCLIPLTALIAIIPLPLFGMETTCLFCILDTNIHAETKLDDGETLGSIITIASNFYTKHRDIQPTKIWYFNKLTNEFHNALNEPETHKLTLQYLGFYKYFSPIIIN